MAQADPLLLRTEKGSTALWKGVYLYPPADPLGYARRKARLHQIPPRSLVFVPSVGLGHGLAELLSRLTEGSAVLCVETEERVMALAVAEGLPTDPRLCVVRTTDETAVAQALQELGPSRFRRVVEVPLSAGYRLNPGLYARFRGILESELSTHWRNRMTLIGMGNLLVRNIYDNLPLLPGSWDFSSLSSSMPAVVAGAGPSLETGLPILRSAREKYLLVAADTALPVLMAESLPPDIIVTLESQVDNLQDFVPFRTSRIPLACELSAHPGVARLFRERLFLFSSRFAPLDLFDRLAGSHLLPRAFPALGSVGVAAAYAALLMTSGHVFLTGLDFSFPGLQTHARGTPRHLAMLSRSSRCRPMGQDSLHALYAQPRLRERDKHGAMVETSPVMKSYRDTLEREIRRNQSRVSDLGETGLGLGARPITGVEFARMLDAMPSRLGGLQVIGMESAEYRWSSERRPADAVRRFLLAEKELLAAAEDLMENLLASGSRDPLPGREAELLRGAGHAWAHFPDEPDVSRPDISFLARARVAVRYYSRRIDRALSV